MNIVRLSAGTLWWVGLSVLSALGGGARTLPQTPAGPGIERVVGEVTSIDVAALRLTLRTDAGETSAVIAGEKTTCLRAQPGAKDLSGATPLTLAEIAVGDRILVRGAVANAGQPMAARQIVVMTRTDIAEARERDRGEWRRRGIVGVVTALDPAAQEITLQMRALPGSPLIVIPTAQAKVVFRRYAPDSVKFSDAQPSSFAALQVGDQLGALGERTADGSRFIPEQIVSGAFLSITATVRAVNVGKGEVVIEEPETRNKRTIVIGPDALLRRLPTELLTRLAAPSRQGSDAPAPRRRQWSGGPGEPRGRMGNAPSLADMMERMPPITLADLKPHDWIAVSSTKGKDPGRLNVIRLLAGLEGLIPEGRAGRGADTDLGPTLPAGDLELGIILP